MLGFVVCTLSQRQDAETTFGASDALYTEGFWKGYSDGGVVCWAGTRRKFRERSSGREGQRDRRL